MALFLHNHGSDVRVNFSLCAINYWAQVTTRKKDNELIKRNFCSGFEDWTSTDEAKSSYSVEGTIKFWCEVTVLPPVRPEPGLNLGDDMIAARKANSMPDLVLVCGGKKFPCHKAVLGARSEVFRAMCEMSRDDGSEIPIVGVEPVVLEKMIEFVYTNRVDLDVSDHAREIFLAADRFDVKGLKKEAECELMSSLDEQNVAEILMLFDDHGCEMEGLEDQAMRYAVQSLSAVIEQDNWEDVVQSHPRLVKRIFKEIAHKLSQDGN